MIAKNTISLIKEEIFPVDIHNVLSGIQAFNSNNLFIESDGGPMISFLWAGSYLRNRGICTIGGSNVGSLAVAFFLCGTKRLALPSSSFFIHRTGYDAGDEIVNADLAEMKALVFKEVGDDKRASFWKKQCRLLHELDNLTARNIAANTRITFNRAKELMVAEERFSAREALSCGIVHGIIDFDQIHFSGAGAF